MKIKISKNLSYILRHNPSVIGIELDNNGYADVNKLIEGYNNKNKEKLDLDLLKEIVEEDDKKRYSFKNDYKYIRASQGHTIKVDVELKIETPKSNLFHGTSGKNIQSILDNGLKPCKRNYVHLSSDMRTALNVGLRYKKEGIPTAIIEYDVNKMINDGFVFMISENGVWQTSTIDSCYIYKIHQI